MLFCLGEPFSSLLKHLQEANIRHVEIVDEGLHTLNRRRVKALKMIAQSNGLGVTVHSPFAGINIAVPSASLRRAVLKRLEKSIFYASKLDCRLWLFHPGQKTGLGHFSPGLEWQLNLDSVRSLLKIGRKEGVEIAVENVPETVPFLMQSVQDFSRFYSELNEDIGLVLDVAHAYLKEEIKGFFTRFSEKIVHIHVSDNDGANDLHLGIGRGTIDWKRVARAVKEANYDKIIMLESTEQLEESLQTLRKLFA